MNTKIKISTYLVLLASLVFVACSKDDPIIDTGGNGQVEVLPSTIQLGEFETDEGEIAISISARDIAKRGYKPTSVDISITSASNIEDQTVSFDEFNNLAYLTFKIEDLEDSVENELKEGVPVDVAVKDENNNVLATQNFSKLSFKPSPNAQEINASGLEDLFAKVTLREDILHYVQIVTSNNEIFGAPESQSYISELVNAPEMRVIPLSGLDYTNDTEIVDKYTSYKFSEIDGMQGVYSIAAHNANDIHYFHINSTGRLKVQSKFNLNRNGGNTDVSGFDNYWFRIEKVSSGLYKIIPFLTNNPLVMLDNVSTDIRLDAGSSTINSEPAYFRILAFDIDWDIQAIEAKFLRPIMPPSATSSAYNSTLRNCSSGSLNQTVGESTTITTTQIAGWEESMSVATTNSGGVSVTISHEAETKFFGVGGKTSGSITGNYQYTKTKTETNTKSGSLSSEKSVQVSVSREVGVPPGTAISVADVYQQYQNIQVPFIQRFRIFGKYQENNTDLSGQEILTQFAFNSFTGVVTDVQSNFIEVTVRGTTTIDRLIETSTETRDIPNACN